MWYVTRSQNAMSQLFCNTTFQALTTSILFCARWGSTQCRTDLGRHVITNAQGSRVEVSDEKWSHTEQVLF